MGYERWSEQLPSQRYVNWLSNSSLVAGAFVMICAALFASPWLAYLAFVVFVAAWLFRVKDMATHNSLFYLAVPLLLIWQPPYTPNVTGDGILIARLQLVSATLASMALDLLGVVHECPGTVLHCAGQSFGVEEACSGIQSFFSLLCFSALLTSFHRRKGLHSALLFSSSALWAVAMNAIRIAAIPYVFVTVGFDLSHGFVHTLLGLSTMAMGLLLLVSTDQLLSSLLSSEYAIQKKGDSSADENQMVNHRTSLLQRIIFVPATAIFSTIFCLQIFDIYSSWGETKRQVDFFAQDVLVDIAKSDGPTQLDGWTLQDYQHEDRVRGADFGERSDMWYYRGPSVTAMISLDQAYPGWHELPVCYTHVGWKIESREVIAGTNGWPFVQVRMRNAAGQFGWLFYCMFDQSGDPVQPPHNWNSLSALRERVKNRLSPSVRGTLFNLAAYQIQLFVTTSDELTVADLNDLNSRFLIAREYINASTLKRIQAPTE
jgi:exosortase